ncbi:MAG: hypothetical protein HYU98_06490 [Deltaproteobacteria bacterium]|nr:hypothetical protein [Deltaproteobacteria bacterium]
MEESALAVKYAGNNEALKTSALTSLWEAYIAQQESRKKPIKAEKSEKVKKPKKNPSTIKWNY